jgi:hypothetical protein
MAGDMMQVSVADGSVRVSVGAGRESSAMEFSPAQARQLAAALVRAADEAESARKPEPVTVKARALRRGDVRDGDRALTVERVRADGSTVHITWTSGGGRNWTQSYPMDTDIRLRGRGPEAAG